MTEHQPRADQAHTTPIPLANVALHPALTHAQAAQVCREIGATIRQDRRGNLRLEPVEAA